MLHFLSGVYGLSRMQPFSTVASHPYCTHSYSRKHSRTVHLFYQPSITRVIITMVKLHHRPCCHVFVCVGRRGIFGPEKTTTLLISEGHPLLWAKLHHSAYQSTMWLTPVCISTGQHRDRLVIKHINTSQTTASWTKHIFMHIFASPWSQ